MKYTFRLLAILTVLISSAVVEGYARYNSFRSKDGILYFFNPQKLNVLENIKSFEYDMTMLTWTDSVTINFSIVSESMAMPTDFVISSGESKFVCHDYSLLFVDLEKNRYKLRMTSRFPLQEIEKIIGCPTPPVFEFRQDGIERAASYKNKSWKTDREKIKQVMGLYYQTR